jgi:hypothetical protein
MSANERLRPVDFTFDEQQPGEKREVTTYWNIAKERYSRRWRRRMGRDPVWDNDQNLKPLQAADMLAWSTRRAAAYNMITTERDTDLLDGLVRSLLPGLSTPLIVGVKDIDEFAEGVKRRNPNVPYETGKMRSTRHKKSRGF